VRLFVTAVLATAAIGLAPAPSHATFPAAQQRLLILTEASGTVGLRLLGPGSQTFDFFVPLASAAVRR
jgi:hypothetical protein